MNTARPIKLAEPWYKQGWPWFLIAFPAIAVVAGIITLWLAMKSWDGLVVDDYYQEGKAIEKTIARSVRARELGLAAQLTVRADEVRIALSAKEGVALPPTLIVTFAHPTRGGQDQNLLLKRVDGVFAGPLEPLAAGRWLIQLEDESRSWRLNGTTYLPAETEITITPSDSQP